MPNQNEEASYESLKPIAGEPKYVDYDPVFDQYGIFGSDSGFCYASYLFKDDADSHLLSIQGCK